MGRPSLLQPQIHSKPRKPNWGLGRPTLPRALREGYDDSSTANSYTGTVIVVGSYSQTVTSRQLHPKY
eukprot:scaffold2804_cov181-Amphora_coffeaeformis.AAC.14